MGVITDDNSLYYMRARYYNPQIKRFINQDILTGNIGNNKSLNRYSYVEGNPVSYTDPFGLSPYKMISDGIHNTLEALGVIPGIGNIFDGINTAYYLLEGNLPMAFYSAMCAMPYGDIVKLKKYAPKVMGFFGGAEIAAQLLQSAGCDSIQTIFSSTTSQYSHFAEYEDNSQFTLDDYLNIALDTSLLTMNVTASFKSPVTGKVDAGDVNVGRVDGGNAGYKGGSNPWGRNLDNTSELNVDDFLTLNDNGVVKVNTSGSDRPLSGAPNSYYKTGNGEHIFVYDGDGKLIYDISSARVKGFKINVAPNGVEYYQAYKLEGAVPNEIKELFGW